MTTTPKVLGQLNPSASTATTLYTVGASTSTICSSIVICNQGDSTNYRVAIRPAGATLDPKHYIVKDAILNSNESTMLVIGVALATTDVVTVYAGTANVSFNIFGSEFS